LAPDRARARSALALLALAGCGDDRIPDLPRTAADEVVIVAHQDDDLLFMQPELSNAVARHDPIIVVYVTAGDGGNGLAFAQGRIAATQAAYGMVAGSQDWTCDWVAVARHPAYGCRLLGGSVSLVYLGYPDGGLAGELPSSLRALWTGEIETAETIAA